MLYAIVPVKRLVRAKTRLAPALSFNQRLRLARHFLHRTLGVVARFPGASRTIIVSADPAVLHLARSRKMIALPEPGHGNINRAINIGSRYAKAHAATSVLILPTDLPLLDARSLRHFSRLAATPTIRIAPDRHETGTNALYLQPPRAGFARFGVDSLRKHRAAAPETGSNVEVVRSHDLTFDVDVPADLTVYGRAIR